MHAFKKFLWSFRFRNYPNYTQWENLFSGKNLPTISIGTDLGQYRISNLTFHEVDLTEDIIHEHYTRELPYYFQRSNLAYTGETQDDESEETYGIFGTDVVYFDSVFFLFILVLFVLFPLVGRFWNSQIKAPVVPLTKPYLFSWSVLNMLTDVLFVLSAWNENATISLIVATLLCINILTAHLLFL